MSDTIKKWHEMQEEEKYKNDKKMKKMKKIITDDLIEKRLKEKGLSMYEPVDDSLPFIKDYYNVEITDQWGKTPDFSIYPESTSDGYEVWVATNGDGRNICINEDVYYYESDLGDVLYQAISDGYSELIYVDDIESSYFEDGIMQAWEDLIKDKIEEVENELIEEGYELETVEE